MQQKDKEREKTLKNKLFSGFSIGRKIGALVAFLVVFVFCFTLLLASGLHMYLDMASDIDDSTRIGILVREMLDQEEVTYLMTRGLEIYQGIPEDIRQKRLSREYLSYFDELETARYQETVEKLMEICDRNDYRWIDLRVEDPETERTIYLMDTDPGRDDRYVLGYWEEFEEKVPVYSSDLEDDEELSLKVGRREGLMISTKNVLLMWEISDPQFVTIVPYMHPQTGDIIGYLGFGVDMSSYTEHRMVFRLIYMICMFIILFIVLAIVSYVIHGSLSKPISELAKAARNYVSDKDKYRSGHYFENVRVSTHDEVRVLRDSMSNMEKDIEEYMNDLTVMITEKERSKAELAIAAKIQSSMLPEELTDYEGIRNFEITSFIRPAREVGGDFYDFFAIDDDHILLAVADVSGKGVPAALFMVGVMTLIMVEVKTESSPAGIADMVNQILCERNPEAMFASLWLGVYCASEGRLRYVNAGHRDPALYRAASDRFEMIREEHDIVLGVLPDEVFTEREIKLNPGDRIYIYTDGIPEALAGDNTMYGPERLMDCLNDHRSLHGRELMDAIVDNVDGFTGGTDQFDDMTSVLMEIL